MKFIAICLSLLLLGQFTEFSLAAQAETISFTPQTSDKPASLQGQLPVTKVGALLAADALAILNGNEIKIEKKSKSDANPQDLLTGILMSSTVEESGKEKSLVGYAYFTGGEKIDKLDKTKCQDKVTLISGRVLNGHITCVDATGCTMDTPVGVEKIAASQISGLHSSHSFQFSIPLPANSNIDPSKSFSTDVHRIKLKPTCIAVATGSKTKSSKIKSAIIIATTITLVATAIAVPIAVAVGTHHSHHTSFTPPSIPSTPTTTVTTTTTTTTTTAMTGATATGATSIPSLPQAIYNPRYPFFIFRPQSSGGPIIF